jgi:hypothetical protein
MRKLSAIGVVLALLVPTAALAWKSGFSVRPGEFDPARTYLVQADWVRGIGCPTKARTYDGTSTGSYTDPACATGDKRDRKNEGLLLAKTGPTTNFASATAEIKGFKGKTLTELGWDIRKPNGDPAGPRGSHCGAGAARWNVTLKNGTTHFIGCNSPPPTVTAGAGFQRHRWTGAQLGPVAGQKVKRLSIVFDEGYDTGPDNFGLAVLDNIDVNGVVVGRGSGDRDDD